MKAKFDKRLLGTWPIRSAADHEGLDLAAKYAGRASQKIRRDSLATSRCATHVNESIRT